MEIDNLKFLWKGEKILEVFKPFGMTPKEVVEKVKQITKAEKAAFSGRLDPLACGVIRVYLDEKCEIAPKDDKLDKIYKFKFAFDIKTTSADMLGFPTYTKSMKGVYRKDIIDFLETIKQSYNQRVPIHSSFPVANKFGEKHPLWWWAQQCRENEVTQPYFERKLYDYFIFGFGQTTLHEISELAIERIHRISENHNFNQKAIQDAWRQFKGNYTPILTFEMCAIVSSGFYIRQLVEDIGTHIGINTMTIEIERTKYHKRIEYLGT